MQLKNGKAQKIPDKSNNSADYCNNFHYSRITGFREHHAKAAERIGIKTGKKMNKLIKSKKAKMSVLQELLLFLAVTVVFIIFFFIVLFPIFGEISDKELCRTSVMAKYGGKAGTLGTSETRVALQCYTQNVKIKSDGVYKSGREREEVKIPGYEFPSAPPIGGSKIDFNNKKIEIVKRAIASEMYDCWDQFSRGQLSIFTEQTRCVICSEITFESNWLDVSGLENFPGEAEKKDVITNFGEFLNTQTIPGHKETYAGFFEQEWEPDFLINTKVETDVVFKAISRGWLESYMPGGGVALGCVGGVGVGVASILLSLPTGPIGWIVGVAGAVATTAKGCLIGGVAGTAAAAYQGEDWFPSLVVGPEGLVAAECSRLY